MKYFSMFAGIGGFDLALNRLGHECVGYSEIDKWAIQTYEKNFKGVKNYGDARKIDAGGLPDFDLLCGGFPCQAFSVAGKRRGFEDTRGTLFFEIARILGAKRPRYFLLENVKGLLNHEGGKTYSTILLSLAELGYGVEWMVLNSKFFGVAQNRERVFLVGCLGGEPRPEILPFKENAGEVQGVSGAKIYDHRRAGEIREFEGTCPTIRGRDYKDPKIVYDPYNNGFRRDGIAGALKGEGVSQTGLGTAVVTQDRHDLRTHKTEGEVPSLKQRMGKGVTPERFFEGKRRNIVRVHSLMPRTGNPNDGGTGHLVKEDNNSYCLDSGNCQAIESGGLRRLTPVECERLQGFPDGWTEGVSDTQRYRQLGNAVTVNVVYEIAKPFSEDLI